MADGVEHLEDLMTMLMGCGLFLVIWDNDDVVAVWRQGLSDHGCFDVTRALALGNDMPLALMNGLKPIHHFSIRTDHVMGAFAGDTITIDTTMSGIIANELHDAIEAGVLVGQKIIAL